MVCLHFILDAGIEIGVDPLMLTSEDCHTGNHGTGTVYPLHYFMIQFRLC